MTAPMIPCERCSGTGEIELTGSLRWVLDGVEREYATERTIAGRLGIRISIESDLEILESYKLVERREHEDQIVWRRT